MDALLIAADPRCPTDNGKMTDDSTGLGKGVAARRLSAALATGALALGVGSGIAWVDTRPNWDDTGVTAGALLLGAGLAALLGLRWWLAALLVGCPLVVYEHHSAGWAILASLAFTTAGSAGGAAVRRLLQDRRPQ